MVTEITQYEEMRLWRDEKTPGIRVRLSPAQIEEWKLEGNFKFVKNELIDLPHIKFHCSQLDSGSCVYSFFFHSKELKNRFVRLLNILVSNKPRKHLKDLPNEQTINFERGQFEGGTPKLCNLF